MKNVNNDANTIESKNQKGGITAQNVTINNNHYSPFSKGLGTVKVINKNKPLKWSIIIVFCSSLVFGTNHLFFKNRISTKEQFHQFILTYLKSVNDKNADAHDYFADNISTFYLEKNINPAKVNSIRKTSDYRDGRNNIDVSSIVLKKAGDINYWRFKSAMICWRPSKSMFQKCNVELEYGINSDNKITSIEQIRYWDLVYTKENPGW